jgi:putative tricarboxylic transport membrane protein
MDSKRIDIFVGIALCVLSLAIYLYAGQYAGRGVNTYGPNFFPQALSILMFCCALALIFQAVRGNALAGLEKINKAGFVNAAVTLVMAILYVLIMQIVGFFVATVIFLFAVMMYLRQKNILVRAITSITVAAAVWGIFHFFLKIPLPEGIFLDQSL